MSEREEHLADGLALVMQQRVQALLEPATREERLTLATGVLIACRHHCVTDEECRMWMQYAADLLYAWAQPTLDSVPEPPEPPCRSTGQAPHAGEGGG